MRHVRTWMFKGSLAGLGLACIALVGLRSPVRAMVGRAAPSTRAVGRQADDRTAAPASGIISISVVANDGGPQPPPARFFGTLTRTGGSNASTTTVTAVASDGATCGSATAGARTSSEYALDITGTDPGCTAAGARLSFRVGGAAATSSGNASVPEVSSAVHADLTAP